MELKGEGGILGGGWVGLLYAFARSHAAVHIPSTAKPISEYNPLPHQKKTDTVTSEARKCDPEGTVSVGVVGHLQRQDLLQ